MGWEADLTFVLGAPASADNVLVLDLWAQSEGMPDSANNWLACSQTGFGGYSSPPYSEPFFPTLALGIEATATFLSGSNYAVVVGYLKGDQGLANLYQAINESRWCSGCQGGHYPIDLYNYLSGSGAPPPEPSPNPPPPPSGGDITSTQTAWENYRAYLATGAPQQAVDLYLTEQAIRAIL